MGAYFLFLNDHRTDIQKAHPHLSGNEFTAEAGRQFRALVGNEKKHYDDQAKELMDEWHKEVDEWEKKHGKISKTKRSASKKGKQTKKDARKRSASKGRKKKVGKHATPAKADETMSS